ncbi:MAG: precorrin-3B C(17)-methyltransferase [Leptolyngbyaceae cyanobacterium SL_1_1]|nr:precorrin-3B C(17)-methyltransferase [Leptolyngbyaceae cyanobacterium RM1_1_2]NJO09211.1 precorrin-3B C(17)-methyltransferase [Leptolyngbyaceae cyanobacterium SL_1_1]
MSQQFSVPAAAIATTPTGVQQLVPLCQASETVLWLSTALAQQLPLPLPGVTHQVYSNSLAQALTQAWPEYKGFIFCLATGAVVRLVAPLLKDKASDPAVVVLDEQSQFAISLCGGHQAGGDRLTQAVAAYTGATPILTGAANRLQMPGVDTWGLPFGWQRGSGNWTGVSAAIAAAKPIQIIQEAGSTLWQKTLPDPQRFQFGWPEHTALSQEISPEPAARVWISPLQRRFSDQALKAQWHPRVLWVGVGCERGTSQALIETAIAQVCQAHHLSTAAIAGIASIDLKADEVGLVQLSQERYWPLCCFTAAELGAMAVPTPSAVVEAAVGTPSVAEAAALLAARQHSTADNAVLRVSKQIVRQAEQPGAVTVAIAEAEREYLGRSGKLWLVGTGPGSLSQITPAAKGAIAGADVVIGYKLYVDLIQPLLHPSQIVEAMPITQERDRAERAIELAQWGLTVAVISSGDCGIYGMAGLVLELLQAQDLKDLAQQVQVFPGISALQAAAARVGAPLMHDFCAISLSDLLTPWLVIEQRLQAAAAADFVVALYNPKSQKRTKQIAQAQQIFLQHRSAATPVALVQSAYRDDESVTLTTLAEFLQHPIDMLTTVLIGNHSSQRYGPWIVTPRGYLS